MYKSPHITFNEIFILSLKKKSRKNWIQNFVLGSRNNVWEVLNFMEVIKKLEIITPFIKNIIKNQGTILILFMNNQKFLERYFQLFISYIPLFESMYFYDSWKLGSLSNYNHIRFLNMRQLPSLIFLFSFENNEHILKEALHLRIPVISLVDSFLNFEYISKYILFPIPLNYSLSNIYFFLSFLKHIILKENNYTNFLHYNGYIFESLFKYSKNMKIYSQINKVFFNLFFILKSFGRNLNHKYYSQGNLQLLTKEMKSLEIDYKKLNYDLDNIKLSRRYFHDRNLFLDFLELKESIGFFKKIKRVFTHSFFKMEERFMLLKLKNNVRSKLKKNSKGFYSFWYKMAKYSGLIKKKKKVILTKKQYYKELRRKNIEKNRKHRLAYLKSIGRDKPFIIKGSPADRYRHKNKKRYDKR